MDKTVLDMCCGSRMFWFDRSDPRVVFVDIRCEELTYSGDRQLVVKPDIVADFRALPFADETFQIVVFDPPHLLSPGPKSWLRAKYGGLKPDTWRHDITAGFREAFRVLKPHGTLIFKWNETDISAKEVLKLTDRKPLCGHPSGKRASTHWVCFLNEQPELDELI